jgi:hypothetical protein
MVEQAAVITVTINWNAVALAALIGGIGSLAYFTTLAFGFVGNEELLGRFLPGRRTVGFLQRLLRVTWFTLIGASVAAIFQMPQEAAAPIQAFIVGTTWPSIVAQVLTGRQGESPASIQQQFASLLGQNQGGQT